MTNPIAVNMSDRIWNEMQDIIKAVGWAALGEACYVLLWVSSHFHLSFCDRRTRKVYICW
jgi:hypothetical protein